MQVAQGLHQGRAETANGPSSHSVLYVAVFIVCTYMLIFDWLTVSVQHMEQVSNTSREYLDMCEGVLGELSDSNESYRTSIKYDQCTVYYIIIYTIQ